jgi:hypothetical protein
LEKIGSIASNSKYLVKINVCQLKGCPRRMRWKEGNGKSLLTYRSRHDEGFDLIQTNSNFLQHV